MSEKILSTDYKRGRHNPPKALDLAMPPEELSAPSHSIHQGPLTKAKKPFFLEEALPVYTLQNLSGTPFPLRSSVVVLLRGDLLNLSGTRRSSGISRQSFVQWRWGWSLMCTTALGGTKQRTWIDRTSSHSSCRTGKSFRTGRLSDICRSPGQFHAL